MKLRKWALTALGMLILGGCSPLFILRAGYEEAKILSRRQSIARLVQDPSIPEERRAKLELVLEVRDFAADSLLLDVEESYTTFSQLDSDTLALVLTAAQKDSFEPYTWWFPIVGRVPYRAFFSESGAEKAVRNLEADGLDAYVRPTSAFSTLGWFNDPLVSPLLRYDSVTLANTIIHELTHNTVYIPGEATFNESFANFVGARGAIEFYCNVKRVATLCGTARAAWRDERTFARYLTSLVDELEVLYARRDLDREQKLDARELIFTRGQSRFEDVIQPRLEVLNFRSFAQGPLNNAFLIARRIYYRDLDVFEAVYQDMNGDLPAAIHRIEASASAADGDPYEAVRGLLAR